MATTVKAVTARKRHRCDESWGDVHFIAPGHRYLRHVAFPGDDVNGGDQPWVLRQCVACAEERDSAGSLIAGACVTFCCGDVPCALSFNHDSDHSCRRCAEERARSERMMELVGQLSPETRTRIAHRLDDRFHEITGTEPYAPKTTT